MNLLREYSLSGYTVRDFDTLDSTNDYLKRAADCAPDSTVATALMQTGGKGSRGRSFYSEGGGLYFSVLLKRGIPVSQAHLLTPAAAVAVAEGLEKIGAKNAGIKWVNDIYIESRKVCGILTETKISADGQSLAHAIIGIGVNLYEPPNGFPDDIKNKAGAVFKSGSPDLRERCLASILEALSEHVSALPERKFLSAYRERSVLLGREVEILGDNPERDMPERGTAIEIDDDCRLIVRTPSGMRVLNSGEVSVKI